MTQVDPNPVKNAVRQDDSPTLKALLENLTDPKPLADALRITLIREHLENTRLLLEAGADPHHKEARPLHWAANTNNPQFLKLLCQYTTFTPEEFEAPTIHAARTGLTEALLFLTPKATKTSLHQVAMEAFCNSKFETLKTLLQNQSTKTLQNLKKNSPILYSTIEPILHQKLQRLAHQISQSQPEIEP